MQNCNIDYEDYKDGYCFWGFYFTPDQGADQGYLHPMKTGNLRLEFQFAKSLTATVNVIVYAEFENLIEINGLREVVTDFRNGHTRVDNDLNISAIENGEVCVKDQLPDKKPLYVKAYIVNTDLSQDPEQYWVAIYFDEKTTIYRFV